MNTILKLLLPLAVLASPMAAMADDDDHKGRKHKREFKEEFWDGNCKVEREYKGNGDYKEERKCKEEKRRRPRYREEVHYVPVEAPEPRPRVIYEAPEPRPRVIYEAPEPRPRVQIHIDATSNR